MVSKWGCVSHSHMQLRAKLNCEERSSTGSTWSIFSAGAEFCAWSGILICLVISRVELIRKDEEIFRSACKIPPSGKPAIGGLCRQPPYDSVGGNRNTGENPRSRTKFWHKKVKIHPNAKFIHI